MVSQGSPGVTVKEIDLTGIIPAVSTTVAGIAGLFRWGPVEQRVPVPTETELVRIYGRPGSFNGETWFSAANFLAYADSLFVVRVANTSQVFSAQASIANGASTVANTGSTIKNADDYDTKIVSLTAGYTSYANSAWAARYPGALGNSLKISVCETAESYYQSLNAAFTAQSGAGSANITFTVGSNAALIVTANAATGTSANLAVTVGDYVRVGNSTIGFQELKVASKTLSTGNLALTFESVFQLPIPGNATSNGVLSSNLAATDVTFDRYWEFYKYFDRAPGTSNYTRQRNANSSIVDELHIVVSDYGGLFTGVKNQPLETFSSMSRASDAKTDDGANNYYVSVMNQSSNYVWWFNHPRASYSNTAQNLTSLASTVTAPITNAFTGGSDGTDDESNVAINVITGGYDFFANPEDVEIDLLIQGKARGSAFDNYTQLSNYIIDNICETRLDCVLFITPDKSDMVGTSVINQQAANIVGFRNSLRNSSYWFADSSYKYQYDKYNDMYRWVPLNGDTAGIAARSDMQRDAWWSFAGYNRGQYKNIVKLAWNPKKFERDLLYRSDINPVVNFPGQGTILYGDKTGLGKPSAFDRINVRRLFIVLEKAISRAAKFQLFEFNDEFTRATFRNLVEPYLRDIQGRRGLYDYRVRCDETNNTPEVIDNNEFRGDIFIKPAKSINWITLNFVAVRTGVEFNEVVGAV